MERNGIPSLWLRLLIILACFATSIAVWSDIDCLRSIKESLEDPFDVLSSWSFTNHTEGFVCRFTGVECWHPDESKVLNLQLSDMGLRGPFPMGIRYCTSMVGFNLSGNHLSGLIPSNLSDILPFITTLDLSNNNLSGPIPPSIANCTFINVLKLDNNHLTGPIPPDVSGLDRLKEFSVSNNRLSGPVPIFHNGIDIDYANNLGLCGGPLHACKDKDHDIFFSDHPFFPGFIAGFSLSVLFMFLCWPRLCTSNMGHYHLLIEKIKGWKYHLITGSPKIPFADEFSSEETKVTAMEKYIRRLSLLELEMATNNFDPKNVIGYGDMGLMYKAVFPNGLQLAVKRLHKFESYEKEFLSEIEILGRLRQTNLVPLLGFCFEMEKKFLVYNYTSNGTLHNRLHCRPKVEGKKMGWTLRLKIAVGIAQGLACLHHNNVLRVAHLKISSKCILLDDKFEPKISNFGDAMILVDTDMPSRSYKYVVIDSSPYKEDVNSFGNLLLELVTGREPSTWINSPVAVDHGEVMDECLIGKGFDEEIYRTIRIAENCIHRSRVEATTMLQVYQVIRAVGISRREIDVEINEGDV